MVLSTGALAVVNRLIGQSAIGVSPAVRLPLLSRSLNFMPDLTGSTKSQAAQMGALSASSWAASAGSVGLPPHTLRISVTTAALTVPR